MSDRLITSKASRAQRAVVADEAGHQPAGDSSALGTPYYSEDGITIYHGDAREILPSITSADLVLTDPPYGIGLTFGGIAKTTKVTDAVYGDDEPFDPTPLLRFPKVIIFGANYFAARLPVDGGWLVWDKVTVDVVSVMGDAELAWTNFVPKVRVFRHMWNGGYRASERGFSVHPTQKPVALMRWCLSLAPDTKLVLDPYMGSGPVLRAAKDAGIQAIGIEIEERYCEIAAKRLIQQTLGLSA